MKTLCVILILVLVSAWAVSAQPYIPPGVPVGTISFPPFVGTPTFATVVIPVGTNNLNDAPPYLTMTTTPTLGTIIIPPLDVPVYVIPPLADWVRTIWLIIIQ